MAENQQKPGIGHGIAVVAGWFARQVFMPAAEKAIPQGAAELAQALFTGNGYMPYGPTERPMDQPAHGVHGPQQEPQSQEAQDRAGEAQGHAEERGETPQAGVLASEGAASQGKGRQAEAPGGREEAAGRGMGKSREISM
jgi:hypothetical protein